MTAVGKRRRVMITGSGGHIAKLLVPLIADDYQLVLVDRHVPSGADDGQVQLDVCDEDRLVEALRGVDALVHLAGQSAVSASWEELRSPNVDGVVSAFEAARRAGVGKVVFASSNHATGIYDRDELWPLSPEMPVRPDSLYGATKAFGEAVGRYYADTFGLSVICLRIGWVLSQPHNEQARRMWLSPADLKKLLAGALDATVGFGIYYGVSNNTCNHWDIDNARRDLAYEPTDDAERFF